ncbi:hypothetical protein ACQ4M3_05680 [Leptolyngbya sp. AN03gr2]|uniref:hypothetical protein n=1 Tax=unclassified Leptolyngbya TaxID=2650499 RepID=UPI003D31EFF4
MSANSSTLAPISTQIVLSGENQNQQRLDELAAEIRYRLHKSAHEIGAIARCLVEAKQLFPRGQNQAFLDWAKQKTGLEKSAIYNYLNVEKMFGRFLTDHQDSLQIDPTALIVLSARKIPEAARKEAIALLLEGQSVTYTSAKEIVQRHQPSTFEKHQLIVEGWGTLFPPVDDQPLQLVDHDQQRYTFESYQDLKKAFKEWQKAAFEISLDEIQSLLSPHWSVTHRPTSTEPFRLELDCSIVEPAKVLFAKNPRSVFEWWQQEGRAKTERLITHQQTSFEIQQACDLEITDCPSCLNCGWHDANYPGCADDEYWCGYYRKNFSCDRAEKLPHECGKWHFESKNPRPFQKNPKLSLGNADEEIRITETESDASNQTQAVDSLVTHLSLGESEFSNIIQTVSKLNFQQLQHLEQIIQQRKNHEMSTDDVTIKVNSASVD